MHGRHRIMTGLVALGLMGCVARSFAAEAQVVLDPGFKLPVTLVHEAGASIERGVGFLLERQASNGSWLYTPPVTALACMALHRGAAPTYGVTRDLAVEKGRRFILANVREDGAICPEDRSYVSYSTAICLTALAVLGNPNDVEVMRKARHFLIGSQLSEDNAENPTPKDDPFYGGIGYGSAGPKRPDLSNTQWALEALYATDYLAREPFVKDENEGRQTDLAWDRAAKFLETVQNLQKSAEGTWIVTADKDGGFRYGPVSSKASEKYDDTDSLRSYGSMTYAGLKSMIYARLDRDDPRVVAAIEWTGKHYTLDENPGMGAEGHFYYLHTLAKACAAYGDDVLTTSDGHKHAWRSELVRKLLNLQKGDGSWVNDASGRWQESIPELVTCYALLTLETAVGESLAK